MPACERRLSALPMLTYLNVRCAPVLENPPFSARPDLNLNTPEFLPANGIPISPPLPARHRLQALSRALQSSANPGRSGKDRIWERVMNRVKLLLAGLLALVLFPAASLAQALPDLGGKTVVVVTENAYFPLQFVDPASGKPVGWEYDAVEELSKRLNFKVEYQNTSWDAMIQAVSDKQYDMGMTGITIKDDRKEKVDFSDPYMRSEIFMLVRADESRFAEPKAFAADEKLLVGAQAGTSPFYAVRDVCGLGGRPSGRRCRPGADGQRRRQGACRDLRRQAQTGWRPPPGRGFRFHLRQRFRPRRSDQCGHRRPEIRWHLRQDHEEVVRRLQAGKVRLPGWLPFLWEAGHRRRRPRV
jgi:hypothetical protein